MADHHSAAAAPAPVDFIRTIVDEDLATGKHHGRVATRFPPEPNGYLHIGHAKSICLNFGIADEHRGICNLRFDDTNPAKEEVEYVDAIKEDVAWLGFRWSAELYASDYFERLYQFAVTLITRDQAYVDSLTADEIRAYRGTLTEPGRNSPYRNRPIEESLDLFARMKSGEFPDGAHVLRAKIDMASPNFNMRDPTLYRIRHATHHRTGDAWFIYPMYDFAHPLSDALERITHSLCTLEFEDHRPLYDWLVSSLFDGDRPQQIEFARLNLNYTVMSKRKLLQLVQQGHVSGWNDPRLPTISGLRRRGYTPESIRDFCARIGVAKKENVIDMAQLEHSVREDLNRTRAARDDGAEAPEGRADQLSRRAGRRGRRHQQPRGRRRPARARCRFHASCTSSATTSWRIRRRNSSASRRAGKCVCGARSSSRAPRSSRTTAARSSSCAAPTIRPRAAATRRTAAR